MFAEYSDASLKSCFTLSHANRVLRFMAHRPPFAFINAHPMLRLAAEQHVPLRLIPEEDPSTKEKKSTDVSALQRVLSQPREYQRYYKDLMFLLESRIGVRMGNTVTILTVDREGAWVRCVLVLEAASKQPSKRYRFPNEEEAENTVLFDDWEEALLHEEALQNGETALLVPPPPLGWWVARQRTPVCAHMVKASTPWLIWSERHLSPCLTTLHLYEWAGETVNLTLYLSSSRVPLTGLYLASSYGSVFEALLSGAPTLSRSLQQLELPLYNGNVVGLGESLSELCSLKRLNLSYVAVPSSALENALAQWDGHQSLLEEVEMCGAFTSLTLFHWLTQLPFLRRVDLSAALTDRETLAALRSDSLTELSLLAARHVDSLEFVKGLPHLSRLNLSKTVVTESDLQALHDLPFLRDLTLSSCPGLRAIDPVWSLPSLETLEVSYSCVGDQKDATRLVPVWWGSEEARTRKPNETLHTLNVDCSSFDEVAAQFVVSYCRCLHTLHASFCQYLHRVGVLGQHWQLEALVLRSVPLHSAGLDGLEKSVSISEVDLTGCANVVRLSPFASLPLLSQLIVDSTGVTDQSLVAFVSLWEENSRLYQSTGSFPLRYLSLQKCAALRNVSCLGRISSLKRLVLSSNHLFDASLSDLTGLTYHVFRPLDSTPSASTPTAKERREELVQILKGLTASPSYARVAGFCEGLSHLHLYDCPGVRYIAPLGMLVGLHTLDLSRTSVDSASLAEYVQVLRGSVDGRFHPHSVEGENRPSLHFRLQKLSLSFCAYLSDFTVLYDIPSLLSLDLSGTPVMDVHLIRFGNLCADAGSSRLVELHLDYCSKITNEEDEAEGITGLLPCTSLQVISLKGTLAAKRISTALVEEFAAQSCRLQL